MYLLWTCPHSALTLSSQTTALLYRSNFFCDLSILMHSEQRNTNVCLTFYRFWFWIFYHHPTVCVTETGFSRCCRMSDNTITQSLVCFHHTALLLQHSCTVCQMEKAELHHSIILYRGTTGQKVPLTSIKDFTRNCGLSRTLNILKDPWPLPPCQEITFQIIYLTQDAQTTHFPI